MHNQHVIFQQHFPKFASFQNRIFQHLYNSIFNDLKLQVNLQKKHNQDAIFQAHFL